MYKFKLEHFMLHVQEKMYDFAELRICRSFKLQLPKKCFLIRKSAKRHYFWRAANLTNYLIPKITEFAELICGTAHLCQKWKVETKYTYYKSKNHRNRLRKCPGSGSNRDRKLAEPGFVLCRVGPAGSKVCKSQIWKLLWLIRNSQILKFLKNTAQLCLKTVLNVIFL